MAQSKGRKRIVSSLLALVGVVFSKITGLDLAALILQILSGGLGVLGLGHAAKARTIKSKKTISLAALFAAILSVVPHVPFLEPYAPAIEGILATLVALGIGVEAVSDSK